jgi:hypothetical protein
MKDICDSLGVLLRTKKVRLVGKTLASELNASQTRWVRSGLSPTRNDCRTGET